MKSCNYCGRENEDGALRCAGCLADLTPPTESAGSWSAPPRPLHRAREELMKEILRKSRPRRCKCNAVMPAIRIHMNFLCGDSMPFGYELHHRCQSCGKQVVIRSALFVFVAFVGTLVVGAGLATLLMETTAKELSEKTGAILMIYGVVVAFFAVPVYVFITAIRNRIIHPKVKMAIPGKEEQRPQG